jgi:hypothetical protein
LPDPGPLRHDKWVCVLRVREELNINVLDFGSSHFITASCHIYRVCLIREVQFQYLFSLLKHR